MAGLVEYRSGTKSTWRGWQWNRIQERLPGWKPKLGPASLRALARDLVVAYLVGPDDVDRICALGRGFRNENIIAIDTNEENIERVRRSGGLGVCTTLAEAIAFWPHSMPFDVVVADYCSGLLSMNTRALAAALMLSSGNINRKQMPIISLNMLRGRDRESKSFRDQFLEFPNNSQGKGLQKHRGTIGLIGMLEFAAGLVSVNERTNINDVFTELFYEAVPVTAKGQKCPIGEYKSGVQVFDSIVFRWPVHCNGSESPRCSEGALLGLVNSWAGKTVGELKVRFDKKELVAKFAALVAQRNRMMAA